MRHKSSLARLAVTACGIVGALVGTSAAVAATPSAYWGSDARSYYPGSSSSYLGLASGGAPWSQADITQSRGGYMFNQSSATSKRFRVVCEGGPGVCSVAGWWSTSTVQDFAVTWSNRSWNTQQCNNMETFAIAANCGIIRGL